VKVSIKRFDVEMSLGNKGIELDIYDNKNNHLGDIQIGKANVEWCKGKTTSGKGVRKTWEELIKWFES